VVDNKTGDIAELQNRIRVLLAQRNESALDLIKEHNLLAEFNESKEHSGESYINFALYYCLVDLNLEKFLHYAESAKPHFDLNNNRRAAYYYGNIAFGYQSHSQMPQSQSYFLKAIDSMEQIPDLSIAETKRLAAHYYNLYILFGFSDLGTLDKRYIDRALELNAAIDNKLGISYCYSAIVAEYDRQGRIEEALEYALRRIKIVEELQDQYQLGLSYCNAGLMYAKLSDKDKAFEHFKKAHDILFPDGNPQYQSGYHLEIAEAYSEFGQYEEAIASYLEAIKIYELVGSTLNLSKIYRLLSKAYKNAGNPTEALLYQEKYSQSLLDNFKLDKLLAVTATEHEYEQKQHTIETAMLKQKNEEINMYVYQLEQSNDDLKQFAHAASHDLREPVRAIVSYATLLEMSLKGKLSTDEQEYITYLKNGGKRMYDMITGILAFSKVNNAQDVADADLNPIYRQAVENIQLYIESRRAVIDCPILPIVKGSDTLLIQLFQNLISNGIKYNESRVPAIGISFQGMGDMYEFCISDNGIGIEDKHKSEVFDMFTRLHKQDQYQGTGIGLSICRKIVERMGGKIRNQPNTAGGTDFIFTLPKGDNTNPPALL
jgi:signal transduction histidine kinase